MEILINPEKQMMKKGQKYHFVFSCPTIIPLTVTAFAFQKVLTLKYGKGKVHIYNYKIDTNKRELHIWAEVLESGSPVVLIVGAILGISMLAVLGLALKQTYLVLAEGIPNLVIYGLIGIGGFFLITGKKFKLKL